jgi:hypothetical protein
MATRAVSKARTDWAYRQLVDCRPTHKITAELAEREGISRRQAREYIGKAYKELAADLEDPQLENREYLAKMIAGLESAIETGVAKGNGSTVIGATRLLSELLGIGSEYSQRHQPQYGSRTGRRYG